MIIFCRFITTSDPFHIFTLFSLCHLMHCCCKILVIAALMHKYKTGIIHPSIALFSLADSVSRSSVQSAPAWRERMLHHLSHV